MKNSNIKVNDKITFQEENLPYEVKAVNKQFIFCSRRFDKKEDEDILNHIVEMQSYLSKRDAYKHLKNEIIYTIIDTKKLFRSTTNLVLNVYDFKSQKDIEECLIDIIKGSTELSMRNAVPLTHFRVDRVVNT